MAAHLSHEGKVIGQAPSALYQGLVVHEALRLVHVNGAWDETKTNVHQASKIVGRTLYSEDRQMTQAVIANMPELLAEVCEWVEAYCIRFRDYFATVKLLGCELPVRLTLDVDGQPAKFASHIDLLFRDEGGFLHLWDWKSVSEAPTRAYLRRNKQLGIYFLMPKVGQILLGGEFTGYRPDASEGMVSLWQGGEWVQFDEEPIIEWIQLRNLKPFKRATTAADEDGTKTEYKKGDTRPLNAIVRDVLIQKTDAIVEELKVMVRMDRAGLYPTNPDPVACHLCESAQWCPHFEEDQQ